MADDKVWDAVTKAILTGYLVITLLGIGALTVAYGTYRGLAWLMPSAHAASFYPACLKPDGDWLHGVTRKECISRDIKGRWYTNSVLKKARRVM